MQEMLTQSLAVDQLGRDIVFAIYLTDLINGQNVRMIESRCGFGFLNKTIQLISVLAEFFVQEFDRDFAIKFCVLRPDTLRPFRPRRSWRRCGNATELVLADSSLFITLKFTPADSSASTFP